MNIAVDLHIHSDLSPCADKDMTPGNIVGMASLQGLSAIAVTDHNRMFNVPAAMEIGKNLGVTVVPGMELETAEEIHVVCLFPAIELLASFQEHVLQASVKMRNKADIFGDQHIYNEEDDIIGECEELLLAPTTISIDEALDIVEQMGGIAYPAHVDRDSYSVLTTLGTLPYGYRYGFVEVSCACEKEELLVKYPELKGMTLMRASDAHYLDRMQEAETFLEVEECSPQGIIKALKKIVRS